MAFFDKLFNKEKTGIDKAMEDAYQNFVENNPITKKAKQTISDAADGITRELEEAVYGEARTDPAEEPSVFDHFDVRSRKWDALIDQFTINELKKYKSCPGCGEAVPADYDVCPYCSSKLPERTADVWICSYCGTENKFTDLQCVKCGKEFHLDLPRTSAAAHSGEAHSEARHNATPPENTRDTSLKKTAEGTQEKNCD